MKKKHGDAEWNKQQEEDRDNSKYIADILPAEKQKTGIKGGVKIVIRSSWWTSMR